VGTGFSRPITRPQEVCVASVAWEAHPRWRLVALANRDEYHARPAAPLAPWDDGSGVIAGRDLQSGGTWLGVTGRRFALVTNFRVPGFPQPDRPSRGGLVTSLLTGAADPATVAIARYNPFNLAVADAHGARILTNHPAETRALLAPGIHGLSNGPHTGIWPKTRQLNADLAQWLADDPGDPEPLFAALARETPMGDLTADWDPHGPTPEPRLSPVFIRNEAYGTRCSTIVLIDRAGTGHIVERRFDAQGTATGETALHFDWIA